jgi:sulfate transport system substrate-binding protein
MSESKEGSRPFRRRSLPSSGTVVLLLALAVLATLVVLHRIRKLPPSRIPQMITLYCFSELDEVMDGKLLPAFREEWKAKTGQTVDFIASYAGSGTITERIVEKFPAEVAILSSEMDAFRLAGRGVIAGPSWRGLPNQGIVSRSPMILLVRPRNPEEILDFEDLAREGIDVIHADPITSGAGEWAILAEYGSSYLADGDAEGAYERLLGVWRNVTDPATSARTARLVFEEGIGDALVTYEAKLLALRRRGALPGEIVYPRATIVSDHVVVKIDRNIEPAQKAVVDAFVDFLWSDTAQRLLVEHGFRSIAEALNAERAEPFPAIEKPFTLTAFGGARAAQSKILDGVWRDRVMGKLSEER